MYKRYPVQPARKNPKPSPGFKASSLGLLPLSALLVLPGLALHRLSHGLSHHVDWRLAAGFLAGLAMLSVITYMLYRTDKRRAQAGGWRTPEGTLHLLELAGGWPAAFLAQRHFRHKISKPFYQLTFWLMVMAHQYAAAELLLHGWMSRTVLDLVRQSRG